MRSEHFDAVVIGAGQGGGPLARALARAGRRTALVERAHVGGTCVNDGCTPTKTLVASARVAHLARRAADYGVRTGEVSVEMERVRARKAGVVESFRSSGVKGLEDAGVALIRGHAAFRAPRRLHVRLEDGGERLLEADLVVIDVGARPARPELDGLDTVPFLDSTSIMELDRLPGRLIVLGGGYVGLEFAQMFRRFGSEVAIVERGAQLLGREDPEVAEAVLEILREDGIEVRLGTEASRVRGEADGTIRVDVEGGDSLTGTHLLVAAGRTPNTDDLGLEHAGVRTDERGHIRVDERLRTGVPGVYALGDATGGPAFTHISYDDFRVLRANLLEGGDATTTGRQVPYVVYIDPQLGRVGMSEREAREAGLDYRVATLPMSRVARAIETGETRGLLRAVVDAGSDRILGFAALGIEGGELMSVVQVAMLAGLPFTALRDAIWAHPALSESLNNLFAALDDPPSSG